jgi:autotransporter-associated beta strand protein
LTGINGVKGAMLVSAGRLQVDGSLTTASLRVVPEAELSGSGTIGGDVIIDSAGWLVAGTLKNSITIDGNLGLGETTQFDFGLGAAGSSSTAVTVAGDLRLDGILNVRDEGGLDVGVYPLFQYGGLLTDNGLAYGTLPAGYTRDNLTLQNQPGAVNLVVQVAADDIRFWNGGITMADGTIAGGTGTWDTATINWTDATGTRSLGWNDQFAVFSGAGGTVTIVGNQSLAGIQFLKDGYVLTPGTNGALDIVKATTPLRVDAGLAAVIDTAIAGVGGLDKRDGGVLRLNGVNLYAGDTTISGGVLQVANDAALGSVASNVTLAGGCLASRVRLLIRPRATSC